jgi:outer membrane protein assembly factor BamB
LTLLAVVPGASGGHWLAYGEGSGGVLKAHLDADLQVLSMRQIAAPAGQRIGSVLIDGNGEGYALQDIGNGGLAQWVHRLGPDALGWQYHSQVACPTLTSRVCRVLGRNGDLVLLDLRQVQRIAPTGERRWLRQYSFPALGSVRWLGESAAGTAAISVRGSLSGNGLLTSSSRVEWLQESGQLLATAAPPRFPDPDASAAIAAVDPEGAAFLALRGPGQQPGHLESIDADGRRRWLGTLPAPNLRSVISSSGEAVCLLHVGHTACLTAQTGDLRWLRQHESSLYRWARLLSDGTLLTIDSRSVFGGGLGLVERQVVTSYAPSGDPRWSRTIPVVQYVGQPVIGISESGTVAFRDQGGRLAYLDRAGNEIATAAMLPIVASRQDGDTGTVDESGRVVFVSESRVGNEVSVTVVAADAGGLAWQVPLGGYHGSTPAAVRLIPEGGGGVLVETSGLLRLPQREPVLGLLRIDAVGRMVWQRRWTARTTFQHQVVSDGAGLIVRALQARGAAHLLLETLDAATGISLSILRMPCPDTGCGVENVRLLAGGQVHMISNGGGNSALPHRVARLDRLPQAALAPARLGLATGSFWQATDLGGSAISLSQPTPQRLVGAWATHSRTTDNAQAQLRWYALDAQLLPESNEAAVVISERPAGSFAAGPGTPVRQVGSGRLRFRSCDAGLLQYRFDEGYNDGVEGSLPLTRLLPPGEACLEPDGRQRLAQANYDTDLSGHWYDPAAPGQGLELARAAPAAGQPGLLFGVWFTFGPNGTASGPGNLRWFTLQGQAVGDGVVRSTLLASIGGRFDDVAATNTFPVGTVELITEGCDRLRLRYHYDDDEVAGDFRALAGEIHLHRLGACPGT